MSGVWSWLTTSANWWGQDGGLNRLREHLNYTLITLVIAMVIALPIGIAIGHTGRGAGLAGGLANALRAVPTLGLLILLTLWALPHFSGDAAFEIPSIAVLVLIAVPPILANTYAGLAAVDPAVRDAAKGMGMTGGQVLRRVEIPIGLPLIIAGLRSAFLQVVSTATVAAIVSSAVSGRLVVDGLATQDYPAMVSGSLLVTGLAILGDRILAAVARYAVSPGLTGRTARRRREVTMLVAERGS